MSKLTDGFYRQHDVVGVAKALLGKKLCTQTGDEFTAAIIVETEAYNGVVDRASHAYGGRRTVRTEVMYGQGGLAYVYLCYGIHYLFNVVTSIEDDPLAVLVRAVAPVEGIDIMLRRRKMDRPVPRLSAGPGLVTQALGINKAHNGLSLLGDQVWIEDTGISLPAEAIVSTTRVGVDYAAEDALLPYRFYIRDNPYVSKK
ncbi:MAG TPA: DNA-3-methyladenine glycosylase [Chitinophagaceae bacterium]|nr:DNA-3-methyladenine glycosylase [Chitinophagaceae bacterium]